MNTGVTGLLNAAELLSHSIQREENQCWASAGKILQKKQNTIKVITSELQTLDSTDFRCTVCL